MKKKEKTRDAFVVGVHDGHDGADACTVRDRISVRWVLIRVKKKKNRVPGRVTALHVHVFISVKNETHTHDDCFLQTSARRVV